MLGKSFLLRNGNRARKLAMAGRNVHDVARRDEFERNLPSRARVVICGGGIMGSSVAYHLAAIGWGPDTVILEKGRCMGDKVQWLSSGLIGSFKPKLAQVNLTKTTIQLYKDMEAKGLKTGWKQCGSLSIARTKDRMMVFRRMKAKSVSWNIDCELVTPEEAKKLCPLIRTDDLEGGLFISGDGVVDSSLVCQSLIEGSKQGGVEVFEGTSVNEVICEDEKVVAVVTSGGRIDCEYFVNCGGFWARSIGKLSNPPVKVPLHACEHYYLHTKEIPGLDPMTPAVRDLDGHVYFREYNGRLLCGGFEPEAKPAFDDGILPDTSYVRTLPEDWDHFHFLLEQMLHRVPSLSHAVLEKLYNAPESFSPDCKWIVGEAPEVFDLFMEREWN